MTVQHIARLNQRHLLWRGNAQQISRELLPVQCQSGNVGDPLQDIRPSLIAELKLNHPLVIGLDAERAWYRGRLGLRRTFDGLWLGRGCVGFALGLSTRRLPGGIRIAWTFLSRRLPPRWNLVGILRQCDWQAPNQRHQQNIQAPMWQHDGWMFNRVHGWEFSHRWKSRVKCLEGSTKR